MVVELCPPRRYHPANYLFGVGIMSQDDVKFPIPPTAANSQESALKLAQDLIRKLDEESSEKLEQVSAEDKLHDQGAA